MNLRRFLAVLALALGTHSARAQDEGDDAPPPPAVASRDAADAPAAPAPPMPSSQSPAPVPAAAPKMVPAAVQPVSPGTTVAEAVPVQPATTILVPAQAVLIKQAAPKVYIVQETAPATVAAVRPAQAPEPAQAPSVTPVAVVREKSRFCQALGALGTRMSGLGQPTVKMGVANVTTAPATTVQSIQMPAKERVVVVQQAPRTTYVQQAPAPTPSPQASPQTASGYQMMTVTPRKWWKWW